MLRLAHATVGTVLCHDREGHALAKNQVKRVGQTRLGAHERVARAIGEFCCNREFSVEIDLDRAWS